MSLKTSNYQIVLHSTQSQVTVFNLKHKQLPRYKLLNKFGKIFGLTFEESVFEAEEMTNFGRLCKTPLSNHNMFDEKLY